MKNTQLVEKYGDKVLDAISKNMNSKRICDCVFTTDGMPVLCEEEEISNIDILKAYVQIALLDVK